MTPPTRAELRAKMWGFVLYADRDHRDHVQDALAIIAALDAEESGDAAAGRIVVGWLKRLVVETSADGSQWWLRRRDGNVVVSDRIAGTE